MAGRYIVHDDGVRADPAIIAQCDRTQHFCARTNQHSVPDSRVSFYRIKLYAAECGGMKDDAIITNNSSFSYDDADPVIDHESTTNDCTRVYFDPG